MKELANISVYPFDIEPFGGWENVVKFHRSLGLDGLEVLTAFDGTNGAPPEAVTAVHFPFSMDWMVPWLGGNLEGSFSREEVLFFYGGSCPDDLIENLRGYIRDAATLEPAYGVFHVTNSSVEEVLTGHPANGSKLVLEEAAKMLNEAVSVFPGGEPPVRMFFENSWWEGLTFTDSEETSSFASSLSFSNWAFLLDTGHLLNTTTSCRSEEDGMDYIFDVVGRLPTEVRRRIEGIHLNLSLSGEAREAQGWPGYAPGDFQANLTRAWERLSMTDQHRPFTTPHCSRLLDLLEPDYVTHEFIFDSVEDRRSKIATQRGALRSELTSSFRTVRSR
ncbi:MAG: hypothetical protein PHU72_02870 [Dethiosulfovibrio sp.]|nr:hypothetical protein [Dethiosulfovibrio sp.]